MKLTRRRFLLAAVPVCTSLYIGGWWIFNVRRGETPQIVISILKKRLNYLNISDQNLEAFASDLQATLPSGIRKLVSWAGILEPVYSRIEVFHATPYTKKRFEELEEFIISRFLLSSDFFYNNEREDREIQYIGLFPYARPCGNPFARFS
jgi:hypothetical protein